MNTVDTDTTPLINWLDLDSLYTRRLIQQAKVFYKVHCNLVDTCPPSYMQHANHISSRTDQTLKYCNTNLLQINAYKYCFSPRSMNIWNRLPCSAVSRVTPSVDNFHKFAMPANRSCSLSMMLLSFKCHMRACFYFMPIVNNSVLFASYL